MTTCSLGYGDADGNDDDDNNNADDLNCSFLLMFSNECNFPKV